MYLGQDCLCNTGEVLKLEIRSESVNEIGLWPATLDMCKLILRPLSKVTDEDAIEAAKIMGMPANAEILKIYRDRESWIEIEYRWVNEVAELNNEDGYSYSATGVPIREVGHAVPFQFLIQRGYALPVFIAPGHPNNGKTAIELGLAIERED